MEIIPQKFRRLGTTLVETLPPIGLAGFLATFLLPELAKNRDLSKRAKSINNQKQIGTAYVSYAQDNNGYYPEVFGFAGVGGKPGNFIDVVKPGQMVDKKNSVYSKEHLQRLKNAVTTGPNVVASIYGATTPAEKRPLNEYVNNNYEIFHDPADIGGTAFNVDSCYRAFGNSYLPAVADDMFRVKRVLGERTEDAGTPYREPGWQKGRFNHSSKSEADDPYEGRSLHESEMINSSNKIIQGDWNWPYDGADAWHAKKGEGGHVMLFGDGHAEYFVFPPTEKLMEWMTSPTNNEKWRRDSGEAFDYIDPKYKWW